MTEKRRLPSMGCLVEASVCPICKGAEPCEHIRDLEREDGKPGTIDSGAMFVSLGIVGPPKCVGCGDEMKPASDIEWACPNEGCSAHGEAIHTGVYPIRSVD